MDVGAEEKARPLPWMMATLASSSVSNRLSASLKAKTNSSLNAFVSAAGLN